MKVSQTNTLRQSAVKGRDMATLLASGLWKRLGMKQEREILCCQHIAEQIRRPDFQVPGLDKRQIKVLDMDSPILKGAEGDCAKAASDCVLCPCRTVFHLVDGCLGLLVGVLCLIICLPIAIVATPILICGACCVGSSAASCS